MSQQKETENRTNLNPKIINKEEINIELANTATNNKTNQFCEEIRPPAVGQEFKER